MIVNLLFFVLLPRLVVLFPYLLDFLLQLTSLFLLYLEVNVALTKHLILQMHLSRLVLRNGLDGASVAF